VLHLDAATLSDADRLRLEQHLPHCRTCREDRASFALLREAGATLPHESIGPRGHARAIARALLEGSAASPTPAPNRLRWSFVAIGAAAAAAAVVIAVATLRREEPVAAIDAPALPAPPDQLAPAPEPPQPVVVELRGAERREVELDGVRARLDEGSVARWDATAATLEIDDGVIDLSVSRAVTLRTREFVVQIAAADLRVTPTEIEISRGTVLLTPSGGEAVQLEAGDRWPHRAEPTAKREQPTARALLAKARTAFAAGAHADAERYADAALDADPSRAETAEARTVLAECAQALGRTDDAIARYRAIADRFADLPAGETALFTAARLEARRGRDAEARDLFGLYLERYPAGRLADDARRRLESLSTP
jgi:hypothetical protein